MRNGTKFKRSSFPGPWSGMTRQGSGKPTPTEESSNVKRSNFQIAGWYGAEHSSGGGCKRAKQVEKALFPNLDPIVRRKSDSLHRVVGLAARVFSSFQLSKDPLTLHQSRPLIPTLRTRTFRTCDRLYYAEEWLNPLFKTRS